VEPIVQTSYGQLRGTRAEGLHIFRGVPFARPPVGARRFHPPERPAAWAVVRDATRFGPAAPQSLGLLGPVFSLGITRTDEDCLSLNVWTQGVDGRRRPVLVWIHGGAFVLGAGSQSLYDGAVLARRGDVVVVTINYRLGSLGFLRLRELSGGRLPASGNEGLLDQIAALEWVRDEIAAFGGDPGNVTIFGESAGAMSCATLLGAPRARGLFHRAILQSGSANYVSPAETASTVAEEFVALLGLRRRRIADLLSLPPERLVEGQARLFFTLRPGLKPVAPLLGLLRGLGRAGGALVAPLKRKLPLLSSLAWPLTLPWRALQLLLVTPRLWPQGLPLQPVLDGDLLPRHPLEAIADGLPRDVPVLVGTNLDEVKLFRFMDRQARRLDEAGLIARCERVIPGRDESGVSWGRRAAEVYRRARAARGESIEPSELWFAIESDRTFRSPAMRLAELSSVHQPRTFAYLFTWRSPFAGGTLGACHALELPFVFGTLGHPLLRGFTGSGPEAAALAERIQDAWIAFARSGDPSHPALPEWPGYDQRRRATMILGNQCRIEDAPREEERAFWDVQGGRRA
jgi:para-nitrobenzyl esterase